MAELVIMVKAPAGEAFIEMGELPPVEYHMINSSFFGAIKNLPNRAPCVILGASLERCTLDFLI